jgi:hypothetical protein
VSLQLLCGASALFTSQGLRDECVDLINAAADVSPALRRKLIGSWAALSADLALTEEARGRDPSFLHGPRAAGVPSVRVNRDVELKPRGAGTAWRLCSSLLWAR